jgi:hypothetical protein
LQRLRTPSWNFLLLVPKCSAAGDDHNQEQRSGGESLSRRDFDLWKFA